jgi:hypothetical protein
MSDTLQLVVRRARFNVFQESVPLKWTYEFLKEVKSGATHDKLKRSDIKDTVKFFDLNVDPRIFHSINYWRQAEMKYMMLVYLDEQCLSEEEREHCYVESAQLTQDLNAEGKYIHASPLHPTATATSVRLREGKRLVTDGPFAETREQLGGFYLIDAADLDEAIRIAERIPVAKVGTIEIRPVLEISGLPSN